jgi:polyisoprenoid-binding protein YceI
MSVTEVRLSTTGLPIGAWHLDPTHSSASFAVKHMAVATFRGRFEKFDATLVVDEDSAELVGTVQAGSLVVKDENLQAHLGSPDSAPRASEPRRPPPGAERPPAMTRAILRRARA